MAIDPYVATRAADAPSGKEKLPPPRGWRASRPGDLASRQPSGPLLGTPGPDAGYALTLGERFVKDLQLAPHEHPNDALAVGVALATKRAAIFGRAPVSADLEVALALLGYLGNAPEELVAWRCDAVRGASHDYACRRAVVDVVRPEGLKLSPAQARAGVTSWRGMITP